MLSEALIGSRRTKILDNLDVRMTPMGREFKLHEYNGQEESFSTLGFEEQSKLMFDLVKDGCLNKFTCMFFPRWHDTKPDTVKFFTAKGLQPPIKQDVTLAAQLLRNIIYIRVHLSKLLLHTTGGLVFRAICMTIKEFLDSDFPSVVEELFGRTTNIAGLNSISETFQQDLLILLKTLKHVEQFKQQTVGGYLMAYLDRGEVQQLNRQRSFIPDLFDRCIAAGMAIYDKYLQEFLYCGTLDEDRFFEFCIWDLRKCGYIFKASDFCDSGTLPFDKDFVLVECFIPPAWKRPGVTDLIYRAFRARRLVAVLKSHIKKDFELPFESLIGSSTEEQYKIIVKASNHVGEVLRERINKVYNIDALYAIIYGMIFDPLTFWVSDFVDELHKRSETVAPDVYDANAFIDRHFREKINSINANSPVVRAELYEYSLFDRVLPFDKHVFDATSSPSVVTDENAPLNDPEGAELEDPEHKFSYSTHLSFYDRVGLLFCEDTLFTSLLPLVNQEHLNKLFRLRFTLTRLQKILVSKRRIVMAENGTSQELLFLTSAQNFISSYMSFVFDHVCHDQWSLFMGTYPTLTTVELIVDAQRLLFRNVFTHTGLYLAPFMDQLHSAVSVLTGYAENGLSFREAADHFYAAFLEMRKMVGLPGNMQMRMMTYCVFRIPNMLKLADIERFNVDPRKGVEPLAMIRPVAAAPSVSSLNGPFRRSSSLLGFAGPKKR